MKEDYINSLNEHLLFLKQIETWYKYTNDKYYSKKIMGLFYEIRLNGKIFFYKNNDEGKLYKIDLIKFIDKMINDSDSVEDKLNFGLIKDDVLKYVDKVLDLMKDLDPYIDKIFKFKFDIKDTDNIIIELSGITVENKFNTTEEFEDFIVDRLDTLEKITINDKIYHRHELLSDLYKKLEYDTLINGEEYEMLDWITKLEKRSKNNDNL